MAAALGRFAAGLLLGAVLMGGPYAFTWVATGFLNVFGLATAWYWFALNGGIA